jgi:hypothetical protein
MLTRNQRFCLRIVLVLFLLGTGDIALGAVSYTGLHPGENLLLEQIVVPLPAGGAFFEEVAFFSIPAGFTGFSFLYFNPTGTMEVRTFVDPQGLGKFRQSAVHSPFPSHGEFDRSFP